jgi:hypothetical protein
LVSDGAHMPVNIFGLQQVLNQPARGFNAGSSAYSTPWRTAFHADGGQCSTVIADSIPR